MNNLINFILAGSTEFTPEVLIRIVVFLAVLECISNIVNSMFRVVEK